MSLVQETGCHEDLEIEDLLGGLDVGLVNKVILKQRSRFCLTHQPTVGASRVYDARPLLRGFLYLSGRVGRGLITGWYQMTVIA